MEHGVRPAEPKDSGRFLELMWESFNVLMTRRGGGLLVATPGAAFDMILDFNRFDELVAAKDRIVLLGFAGGTANALGVGHVEVLSDGRSLCAVDACYVAAVARGRGLGRQLLDEMVAWAGRNGCIGVDGVALPGDRHAKSFFESAGFKARLLTMHRELP